MAAMKRQWLLRTGSVMTVMEEVNLNFRLLGFKVPPVSFLGQIVCRAVPGSPAWRAGNHPNLAFLSLVKMEALQREILGLCTEEGGER